jgi:hydrogenase/urease accessory protein HupE
MKFLLALILAASVCVAHADEFRPAYLEISAVAAETYDILWKVPAAGGDRRLSLHVKLPPGSNDVTEPIAAFVGTAHIEKRRIHQPGGLEGQTIAIDGLAGSGAEVLARFKRMDGTVQVTRLTPSRTTFEVEASSGKLEVARTYTLLGMEHILIGIDHLLFVLALLIIVRGGKRIVLTITAFTVAHSITLVAASLGWLALPGAPVEAVIALSIAFLAREIVMASRGRVGLTERMPWLVAFVFGLLHGLGFAGALAEIGLPANAIAMALLCFNIGVELGQLFFVAVMLGLTWALRKLATPFLPSLRWLPPYAIGGVASFWMIERVVAFWG